MDEMCVCCGRYVPEGLMVCPACCCMEAGTKEEKKEALSDMLRNNHRGVENAVFSRILEECLGIGGRDVRRIISELRKEGKPICSDYHKGYYYAESEADIEDAVKGLKEHAKGVSDTVKNLNVAKVKQPDEEIVIRIVIRNDDSEGKCRAELLV